MFPFPNSNAIKLLKSISELNTYLNSPESKIVLMASTTTCMPCKFFAPIISEVSKNFLGKVAFVKVNLDETPDFNSMFGVGSVPTLIFLKEGKELYRSIGSCSKEELDERVCKVFNI